MAETHTNTRLEAFCDGVFAIAMTLLILDVRLSSTEGIATTSDLWRALRQLTPSVFAFLLSFGIILITWVNHHAALKLVTRESASFIYANGLLLLTVVCIPFTAGLLGEFLRTDHAAPAVVSVQRGLGGPGDWLDIGDRDGTQEPPDHHRESNADAGGEQQERVLWRCALFFAGNHRVVVPLRRGDGDHCVLDLLVDAWHPHEACLTRGREN